MPRDSSGNYSLPAGNPVVGGTTITPTWANPTMSDIGSELTNSLDRNGRGGMLAPFKFDPGTQVAPGMTWVPEPTSGFYLAAANDMRAVIAGVPRMKWTATDVSVWDTGTSAWLPIVGPSGSNFVLTNSPNTLTDSNTFTKSGIGPSAINLQSASPWLHWRETDVAAGAQDWLMGNSGGTFLIYASADGSALDKAVLNVTRGGGTSVASITFGNTADSPTYNFLGTGASTFYGPVTLEGANIPRLLFLKTAVGGWYIGGDGTASNDFTFSLNAATFGRVNTVGQFQLTDGSDAQPSYSFISDTDTGLRLYAPNILGLVTGGTTRVAILNASVNLAAGMQIFGPDGTAAAPMYAFSADVSTGIWRSGSSTIAFSAGGSTTLQINPAGLYATNGTAANPIYSFAADQDTGMYTGASDNTLRFATGGTISFYMDSPNNRNISYHRMQLAVDGTLGAPGYSWTSDTDTGLYLGASNYFLAIAGGSYCCGFYNQGANAQTIFPDGSAAAPSISFGADLDIGMFRIAPDRIGFATGGVVHWTMGLAGVVNCFSSDVPIWLGDGAAATPSYSFSNDPDTGMYRSGPGEVAFSSNGARSAVIFAAGIQLDVGAFYAPAAGYLFAGDPNTGMTNSGSDILTFNTGGVERFSVASALVSATVDVQAPRFLATSGRAIKRETGAVRKASAILARLRPLFYRLLAGDDSEQLGLIAEEVHEVCPQLSDGKTVAYDRLAILLLAAWQEERSAL